MERKTALFKIDFETNIHTDSKVCYLGNYLLKLTDKFDQKRSGVYLIGIHHFIEQLWREITSKNFRSINVDEFVPKRLGIHQTGFYQYKNGRKGISIQILYELLKVWKEFCSKTNQEFNDKWEEICKSNFYLSSNRRSLVILPKYLDSKLSYLAGWICGDGNLASYGNHYLIKISEKSINQLAYVLKPLFKELFSIEPPIYHIYEGGYAIQLNSKPIFRFLTNVLQLQVGKIPKLACELDDHNLSYFLAGIFDSEGYVSKDRYRLTISQAKKEFLLNLKDFFLKLNIKFNGPTKHITKLGIWYTIRLESKAEIMKFIEIVGSHHIDKARRLVKMEERISSPRRKQ